MRRYRWLVFASGLVVFLLTIFIFSLGNLTLGIPRFLAAFAAMFVCYVFAIIGFSKLPASRSSLGLILLVAVACRVVFVFASPVLSDDVYRYLWDGRVVLQGENPFRYPPEAAELEYLRDPNYEKINHKHLETIYPPLAQGAFGLGALLGETVQAQKAIFAACDIAALTALFLLLAARRKNTNLCVIYAWSPLVIFEFSHSGHMDALGIFLLLVSLLMLERRRPAVGSTVLALSFLAKYLSAILVPFFLMKKGYARWVGLSAAVVVAGYLPFLGAPTKLFASLGIYGRHWDFNSLVFTILHRTTGNGDLIRLALTLILVGFAVYEGRRRTDILTYSYRVIALVLLLSPTVYPWYVCWLVPFLCFYTSRAWLYFSGAVVLSYWVWVRFISMGEWSLGFGFLLVEYLPFYGLLAVESLRRYRVGRGVGSVRQDGGAKNGWQNG